MNPDEVATRSVELGRTIASRRKELGITQEDLAILAGLSDRTVGLIEAGESNPRLSSLLAVLHVLGLNLRIAADGPNA